MGKTTRRVAVPPEVAKQACDAIGRNLQARLAFDAIMADLAVVASKALATRTQALADVRENLQQLKLEAGLPLNGAWADPTCRWLEVPIEGDAAQPSDGLAKRPTVL